MTAPTLLPTHQLADAVERHWQDARRPPPPLHGRRPVILLMLALSRLAVVRQRDQCRANSSTGCRISSIFLELLVPNDWNDVWRALFDLPRPMTTAARNTTIPIGRVYVWRQLLHPRIFLPDAGNASTSRWSRP